MIIILNWLVLNRPLNEYTHNNIMFVFGSLLILQHVMDCMKWSLQN